MKGKPSKYYVLLGVFFTSLSSILIRLSTAPSLIISAYRMMFTVLMLLIPAVLKSRKEIINISKRDLILCMISGIFLALHFASWIASIGMTTIASSTVLVSCSPIFVALFSFFLFKEKLSKRGLFSIGLALIGTIIIAIDSKSGASSSMLLGNALAFMGGIFVAGYLIIGGRVRQRISAISYVFIVYLSSAVVLFLLCIVTKTPLYPYPIREFIIFIALAFFCSILGHTIYNWMIEYVSATFISASTLCEPIFASILALIIFREIPSVYTLVGGSIILVGIYIFTTEPIQNEKLSS